MSTKYEIVLGPAATRAVLRLPDSERKELADALRTELLDGPNADKEARFDADMKAGAGRDGVYTGTPLSFGAYVALHRPMTKEELKRLRREQGRRVADQGFYVLDILHPTAAFTRGPQLVSEAGSSSVESIGAGSAQAGDVPPVKAPAPNSPPRLSGEAKDARYRYQRLLYAPMRPSQLAAGAVAAAVPPAVGALLIWALFERSPAHAVGFYFVIIGLEAAALWFAASPLYMGSYVEKRGEELRISLREPLRYWLEGDSGNVYSVTRAVSSTRALLRRNPTLVTVGLGSATGSVELALTASRGFSVFALWPDTEPYLTEKEWRELSAAVTRVWALRGLAVAATIAAFASVGVAAERRQYVIALTVLAFAQLLTAAGALARINWAGSETLNRKSELIARHSAAILAVYGLHAAAPADRLTALGKLSASILYGTSGLPSSPLPGGTAGESLLPGVVDASVRAAVKDAFSGPKLVDFEGWLGIEITDAEGARVTVTKDREVPLRPGRRYNLVVAIATERPSGVALPLRITGGTKRATAEFSVLLDSDDPELRQPAQVLEVRTSAGGASARFAFEPRASFPPPWLWVRVAQRERVVQNFELIGISAGPEG
jgi:hypothetical protein